MNKKNKRFGVLINLILFALVVAFNIDTMLGFLIVLAMVAVGLTKGKAITQYLDKYSAINPVLETAADRIASDTRIVTTKDANGASSSALTAAFTDKTRLSKKVKYLQIALNSNLEEAADIIRQLPKSDRILIEAGTPLIKMYGSKAVARIKDMAPLGAYIVADNKCADLGEREVEMMVNAGANAATCLGVAPIETIDSFIAACKKFNIDSMVDMMNVENALVVLKKLKQLPDVVILHRGVDETAFSKEKQIPFYQIKQIKGSYNVLVAVAGGDTVAEAQRAIFNDADIVVVWKSFYQSGNDTAELASSFLREMK